MAKKGKTKRKAKTGKKRAADKPSVNVNILDCVQPGGALVELDQDVIWWNLTGGTVILVFPYDDVFGRGQKSFAKEIKAGKKHQAPGKVDGPKAGDSFVYAVFHKSTMEMIPGGSPPEIIIEGRR